MRHLKDRPRPVRIPTNAPPTPPLEQIAERQNTLRRRVEKERVKRKEVLVFTHKDAKALVVQAEDILKFNPESVDAAWRKWAQEVRQTSRLIRGIYTERLPSTSNTQPRIGATFGRRVSVRSI